MNTAPDRGAGLSSSTKKGRTGEPGDLGKAKICEPTCSADPRSGKGPASKIRRTKEGIWHGDLQTHGRTPDDQKSRDRRKAATARAGIVLRQVRAWLAYQGLRHPPVELQEVYLEVAIAQYIAISDARPRWTFGLQRWIKRYAPAVYETRTPAWIDGRVQDQRRQGTYFSPAEIGRMLSVTHQAYRDLKLTDIWPAGMTAEERRRDQLDAKAARQRSYNLAQGKVQRPHAQSLARTRPWEGMGISESTFKRRMRRGEL